MKPDSDPSEGIRIAVSDIDPLNLVGEGDRNLRAIESHFGVSSVFRNGELLLFGSGDATRAASEILTFLVAEVRTGRVISESHVQDLLSGRLSPTPDAEPADDLVLSFERKTVRPRSPVQADYVRQIQRNDVVFGIGPAGTGKTYLGVAMALHALRQKHVDRIVLVRPVVEAGEKLGYLPGDLQEKVDPYLRPLYDALTDLISYDRLQKFIQTGVIEICPLAFMRGRTLSRAVVILDEAQNSTLPQMKMFLTRLGVGSRAVVTGDVTQIDLPDRADSGLVQIQSILTGVEGVGFVYFSGEDVVRHRLVRDILDAFDRTEAHS